MRYVYLLLLVVCVATAVDVEVPPDGDTGLPPSEEADPNTGEDTARGSSEEGKPSPEDTVKEDAGLWGMSWSRLTAGAVKVAAGVKAKSESIKAGLGKVAADAQEVSRSMRKSRCYYTYTLDRKGTTYGEYIVYVVGRSQRHTRARGYAHLLNRTAFPLYSFT